MTSLLSLAEVGSRLGGLTPAALCGLIVGCQLQGCLVGDSLKVEAFALRAFMARRPPTLVPTFKSARRRSQSYPRRITGETHMGKNELSRLTDAQRTMIEHAFPHFTEDERAIIDAVRNLRAEEAKLAEPPAVLLEHRYATPAEAERLLTRPRGEIAKLVAENRFPHWKGKVPMSEVLRHWNEGKRKRLDFVATKIRDTIRPQRPLWLDAGSHRLDEPSGYDAEGIATQLGVTKAEARRLLEGDALFAWKIRGCGTIVTEEELEAFKRTRAKSAGGAQ